MPRPLLLFLTVVLIPACDRPPPASGPAEASTTAGTTTLAQSPAAATPSAGTHAASAQTVGHVRVSITKVSIGKVPLKAADGSIEYAEPPRLMIALRIENTSDKKQSGYNTWGPDLEVAKAVGTLTNDLGNELKRITFGFGNNVRGRTVLDTLTPGKVIGDLLVFEAPAANVRALKLVLPGGNCGVPGSFEFDIDATTVSRPK